MGRFRSGIPGCGARVEPLLVLALAISLLGCHEPPPLAAKLVTGAGPLELRYPAFVAWSLSFTPQRSFSALGSQPTVFVHLRDQSGELVRTFDHPLPQWREGEELRYRHPLFQSALGPGLAAGSYALSVGLYDPDLGRFRLEVEAEERYDLEYVVAEVVVPQPSTGSSELRFSEAWQPRVGGSDKQILGVRWLSESGTLSLVEVGGPTRVSLLLDLPDPTADRFFDLELLDPESKRPELILTQSCGGDEIRLDRTGLHRVNFDMSPGENERICTIAIAGNYALVSSEGERRLVALLAISWVSHPAS